MSVRDRYQRTRDQEFAAEKRRRAIQLENQQSAEYAFLGGYRVIHAPSKACPDDRSHLALVCGDITAELLAPLVATMPLGDGRADDAGS